MCLIWFVASICEFGGSCGWLRIMLIVVFQLGMDKELQLRMGLLHWQEALEADDVAVLDLPLHCVRHDPKHHCGAQRPYVA